MIEIRASRRLENDSLVDSQVSVAITGDVLQFMDGFCFIFLCLHICMFQRTLEVLFLVENMVQWDVVSITQIGCTKNYYGLVLRFCHKVSDQGF